MGILLAGLGYASTKSIFFIVLGGVIVTAMCGYGIKKWKRWDKEGRGRKGMWRMNDQKISALAGFKMDVNPAVMRGRINNSLAHFSTSPGLVMAHMPEVAQRIASDQQPGGRLYNLMVERKNGQITNQAYKEKLNQYIVYMAAELGIPYS